MFDSKKYITKGIEATLPPGMDSLLWLLIETMEVSKKDYLQVFELSPNQGQQHIVHRQEQPPYEKEYDINWNGCDELVTAKVFVIDDYDHSTMLLAEEY